jgi:para-nitrobenzyl esterase
MFLSSKARFSIGALFLAAFACGCPTGPKLSPNVRLASDLVYGQGYVADATSETGYALEDLYFDLLEPTDVTPSNRPAVLVIHGGSFTGGSKTHENLVILADSLAAQGYVCFLIDYRVDGDEPPETDWELDVNVKKALGFLPTARSVRAAFVDAKTAMRHIRANSQTYGVDPNRIAAWGESAGAFAALAAGITESRDFEDDGPAYPVPQVNNPGVDSAPNAIIDCWGGAFFPDDEFDPNDPPVMIFHGTFDGTVPFIPFATTVQSACAANAIPYRYYLIFGGGHGCWDCESEDKDLSTLTLEFLADFMPQS